MNTETETMPTVKKDSKPSIDLKKQRSAAYPAVSLQAAVEHSLKLVSAFATSEFGRENAIIEMGFTGLNGSSSPTFAAVCYYGLCDKRGGAYINTELAIRLAHPTSDNDRDLALKEAAVSPDLFKDLFEKFVGKSIPGALHHILVREHRMLAKVSEKVAQTFKETMQHAGLYENGILVRSNGASAAKDNPEGDETDFIQKPTLLETHAQPPVSSAPLQYSKPQVAGMQPIHLHSGIIVYFPAGLAYELAMGRFAKEIAGLETAATNVQKPTNPLEEDVAEEQVG